MDFMIQRHYFSNRNFNIGIRKQENGGWNTIIVYDIERSVCDLYRLEGETEIEVGIVKNIKENKYLYNRLLKYDRSTTDKTRIVREDMTHEEQNYRCSKCKNYYFKRRIR